MAAIITQASKNLLWLFLLLLKSTIEFLLLSILFIYVLAGAVRSDKISFDVLPGFIFGVLAVLALGRLGVEAGVHLWVYKRSRRVERERGEYYYLERSEREDEES